MITQVKIEIETCMGEVVSGALWVGRLGNKGVQFSDGRDECHAVL